MRLDHLLLGRYEDKLFHNYLLILVDTDTSKKTKFYFLYSFLIKVLRFAGHLLSKSVKTDFWGYSSAGRAPALQAGGQRFDPAYLHQAALGGCKNSLITRATGTRNNTF